MTSNRRTCQRREPIALRKCHIARVERAALRARHASASCDRSSPTTARLRPLARERERDGAAAGAQIERRRSRRSFADAPARVRHELGLRSRNQHRRTDLEQQRPEFLLPAYVCNRLALHAALHELLKRPRPLAPAARARARARNCVRDQTRHVLEQQLGVEPRRGRARESSVVAVCSASETVCEEFTAGIRGESRRFARAA